MKQFGKILKFELKYFFKNKTFIGVTIFLVALIGIVMFFPRIMDIFENSDSETGDTPSSGEVMLIKADFDGGETVTEYFTAAFGDYTVKQTDMDTQQIKDEILDGNAECAFVMTATDSYTYYVNNLSMYDMNCEIANETLQTVYRLSAMVENGITIEQAGEIMSAQINSVTESLGVDQMQNYWYTYIMIFALYMVIVLYGQMVASNVASEKSSRAMEVLITSAKPTAMMFGKVISSCIAGLFQLTAIFGSAILFYSLNKKHWGENPIIASIFDMPIELLIYMLIFFVLGFLIYAFLYGAIASTVSKLEDVNTAITPITYLFVFAFIVVVMSFSSGEVDNLLMRICSYIPFTSSMAMFTRIAMSTVPWYEITVSIAILIGSVLGVGVLSAKIYRVGVLLYGTRPKIGSVIKSVIKSK